MKQLVISEDLFYISEQVLLVFASLLTPPAVYL